MTTRIADDAASGTRMSGDSSGNAEVIAATPAATLTDTVRT